MADILVKFFYGAHKEVDDLDSVDENTFRYTDSGLYLGDRLIGNDIYIGEHESEIPDDAKVAFIINNDDKIEELKEWGRLRVGNYFKDKR